MYCPKTAMSWYKYKAGQVNNNKLVQKWYNRKLFKVVKLGIKMKKPKKLKFYFFAEN